MRKGVATKIEHNARRKKLVLWGRNASRGLAPLITQWARAGIRLARRKDEVFLKLKSLLEPFGVKRYYTDC